MDFRQVENKFKRLKAQFEAGTLTEAEFKTKLEDLMIRDEQGSWWMIGYETELWYRHNGMNWVQTDSSDSPSQKLPPSPKWVAIFWITLGWAISSAIVWAIWHATGEIAGGAIWGAIGGLITAITLRIEDILSDWKSMLWITVGWAIGGVIGSVLILKIWQAIGGLVGWVIGGAIWGAIGGSI